MHCCGAVAELIPALIEIELDGLHSLQPCCDSMQPERLKREFGDKILLNGAIDSHHILIDGTPEEVREKTAKIVKAMMPGGGYIAGASHDTILEETPVENVLAMFDSVCESGVYKKDEPKKRNVVKVDGRNKARPVPAKFLLERVNSDTYLHDE